MLAGLTSRFRGHVTVDVEILSATLAAAFDRDTWLTAIENTRSGASVLETGNSADSIASAAAIR